MAEIVSNSKIFKEQEKYQNLSLRSMDQSVELLKSIDKSLKGFGNFVSGGAKELTLKGILKDTLKLTVDSLTNLFVRMSKSALEVIKKGFKSLYESNFVQFFKGLITESYRGLTNTVKPLLQSGLSMAKEGVSKISGLAKDKFLKSDSGQFITQKYGQFKEASGVMLSSAKDFAAKGLQPTKPDVYQGEDGRWRNSKGQFAKEPEKKPEVSALKGINETLEKTLDFWKNLVDKSDDPGSEESKPSLLSRLFKRKTSDSDDDSSSSRESSGSSRTKLGGKLGSFIGGFIGSALGNALTGFVLAFGNPAILKAAGIFAVSLPLIGAGIGGFIAALGFLSKFGIDAISKSLPKLSESLKTFESLNANKLSSVGTGIANFFGSFTEGALGGLLANFTLPDPEKLKKLGQSLKQFEGLDAQNITNSSVALGNILQSLGKASGFKFEQTDIDKLINLSKVLKSMDENLNGDNLKKIGEGLKPIVDNTQNLGKIKYNVNEGSELGPLGQLGKDLSQFKGVNVDNIKNVGPAIAALSSAFKDTKLGELLGTINNALSKFFGGEQKSLSDQLNEMVTGLSAFEKLNVDKMLKIGPAIKSLGQGLKDASEGLKKDFISTIANIFGTEDEGKALVDKFKKLSELGEEGLAKRLTDAGLALQKFARGLQEIGNTRFDNAAAGLELIIGKIEPLISAMRDSNFSPEDTLQGVAEGMKMFENITVPKESVAIQGFLEAVGKGLKVWNFEEAALNTLKRIKEEDLIYNVVSNASLYKTMAEKDIGATLETNLTGLGNGLEKLSNSMTSVFGRDEIDGLMLLGQSKIIDQLGHFFDASLVGADASKALESNLTAVGKGLDNLVNTLTDEEISNITKIGQSKIIKQIADTIRNTGLTRMIDQSSSSEWENDEFKEPKAESTSYRLIANQPFIPGKPLSKEQMQAISLAKATDPGNFQKYPVEVQRQYLKQKQVNNDLGKLVDPKKMAIGQTANISNMPKTFVDNYRANLERRLESNAPKTAKTVARLNLQRLDEGKLTVTKTEKGYSFKPVYQTQGGSQGGSPGIVALGGGTSVTGSYNTTSNYYYNSDGMSDAVVG